MESQYMSQVGQVVGQESPFSTQLESTTKKSRGGNFSIEEDNMVVLAWLNTSLDVVHGNEQKSKTFWRRVEEYFHEHKTFISECNDNSLMNRWSIIQLGTSKCCGYFAQIEALHQSGVNKQDKIGKAKIMYQEANKTLFQFKHCWNVLRHQPKWFEQCQKKKPKRIRNDPTSSPSTPEPINLTEDDISPLKRPMGRKAENEQLKKMKEERKRGTEKKLELLQKSYHIHASRARTEQLKKEERIMKIDTSEMSPMQQEYYRLGQLEIIESKEKINDVE
ncbi:glutathione S-transferase T3-like [Camellia sinensis]|uniref:glutathione S-transferase T3-like n=1 Tax=Camellia sinensis TaxID=4442 RepID=UPI00103581FC|nr:glutathione S-transferase T3-like [Camellia sinensis]